MSRYVEAQRCCDLVMKGGITSGILYPPAICEIAEAFHLVGIGGTSAGAIAACTAAAAEYRRRQFEDGAGFEQLERLPELLAGNGRLMGLFRPDAVTRKAFEFLMEALASDERSTLARLWWKARLVMAGLAPERTLRPIVENGFGLCTGMANGNRPGVGEVEPLTEWLASIIDKIAGKGDGRPLTFGDLRHARIPARLAGTMEGLEHRSIDLRAVTTCVTYGRPYELPFEGQRIFAFDPLEWRRLFPQHIVDYLVGEAEKIAAPTLRRDGKLPLPIGDTMPVVVAARMSLSFPGLFSMVPLYAVNYHDPREPMAKVWFSDGGITSNLPIHRFDALFPRWPTLAINLQYTGKDGKPGRRSMQDELVHMIQRRADGANDLWNTFDEQESALKDVRGFASAVFRSAQTWHDNAFLKLPGYRDRVVEIWLRPDEGGMNLAMPEETITALAARGREAGRRLRERFASLPASDPMSWDGHRWARLRSGLAGLATYLHGFKQSVDHPMPGDRPLAELLAGLDAVPAYPFDSAKQLTAARKAIEELLAYVNALQAQPVCADPGEAGTRPFCAGPRPPVEIGSRAPL